MIKRHTRFPVIIVIIITAAVMLLLPRVTLPGESGTDFMINLWKYRTSEENTGLLTGRPSHKLPESPVIAVNVIGTVDCLQALPLHPNDIIEVKLLDFASRDASVMITGQKITSPGQIPIPFKLTYDPAKLTRPIITRSRRALCAMVNRRSSTAHPVLL